MFIGVVANSVMWQLLKLTSVLRHVHVTWPTKVIKFHLPQLALNHSPNPSKTKQNPNHFSSPVHLSLSLSLSLSHTLNHHLSPPSSFLGYDTSVKLAQLNKNTHFSRHFVLNLLQKWENKKYSFWGVIDPWFNWKVYAEFVAGFSCKYLIWIKFRV